VAQPEAFGTPAEAAVQISTVDATGEEREAEVASNYCPRCSARLASRSCKLICPRCGYYMSCSDFY
jgi:ribosomal protein S27AE